jgi:GTPase SAR1 family protein
VEFDFYKQEELAKNPILICIVGHTNHGKTSTIRTLIENAHVGTVDEAPDTTTKVEGFRVHKDGLDRVHVFDTPGFTNLDVRLAENEVRMGRAPTIDQLIDAQKGMPSRADIWLYNTLRQIQKSHLIIQVLDSREDPYNETYLDEINFLKSCGVPLIVSMNFIYRNDTRIVEWQKVIRSLGVSNIIQFDAHTRTWQDEQDLFKCMRPLLCDPAHKKLHQEFMDFWTELRKTASDEARLGAAEDIRKLLVNVSRHKTKVSGVNADNRQEKRIETQERFKNEIMAMVNEAFSKILGRFGFSFDDVKKHQSHVDGGEGVLTMNFFDHSKLKYAAAIALAAATAIIEAFFGFMSLGIPTLVAAAFGYFGASAWQMESEGGGTEMTFKPTNAVLLLVASAMLSLAKELKSRGRANSHLIFVRLDQDAIKKNSALANEILELNRWKHRDTEKLMKCLHEEINN